MANGNARRRDSIERAKRARASFQIRPLSARQREVLYELGTYGVFVRPLDLGGKDQSHHAKTLMTLAARGLVETQKHHAIYCPLPRGGPRCRCRGHRRYAITKAGLDVVKEMH